MGKDGESAFGHRPHLKEEFGKDASFVGRKPGIAQTGAMVEIQMEYEGDLRVQATHGPSGTKLCTARPVDNMGKGESFSPTDLVATAMGTCMLTIMGIYAQRHQIDLTGTKSRVGKVMSATAPRRIGKLEVDINCPSDPGEKHAKALELAALACPVYQSLHPRD